MKFSPTAFIVPYPFTPPRNGGHKAAYGLAEFLSKEHDIVVISTKKNEKDVPFLLFPVLSNSPLRYISPTSLIRCYRIFKKHKIEHCITHQHFIGLLLLPLFKLMGIRFEIWVQNIEFLRFKSMGKWYSPLIYLSEWITFKMADKLLFISKDDQEEALEIFKLDHKRCITIPYGTYLDEMPKGRIEAREAIIKNHGFNSDDFLILFFGPLSYAPNFKAVELICKHVYPILKQKADFNFQIMICGGGIKKDDYSLVQMQQEENHFLGYVKDIEKYIQSADVMINPVNTGGGLKTKLIEAISLGTTAISSKTGAKGVDTDACGQKLIQIDDFAYQDYADALIQIKNKGQSDTPKSFYKTYFWEEIVKHID